MIGSCIHLLPAVMRERIVSGRWVAIGMLGSLLLLPTVALALTPGDWLMRTHAASQALGYRGTYVYTHDNRVESMRIIRKVGIGGGVRERLYSLDGAKREIIRDNGRIWCYLPDRKIGVHEYRQVTSRQFPNILPSDIALLAQYYQLKIGKQTSRIANRDATQLVIMPRDQFRYGYNLWSDRASGLLLRAALVDHRGRSLQQYLFVSLNTDDNITEQELLPMTAKKELKWFIGTSENVNLASAASAWSVGMLPPGFTLQQRIQRITPLRQTRLEHLVYSDGLSTTSVFIEDMLPGEKRQLDGLKAMGAVHVYIRHIGNSRITVVGEVPGRTVEMIAKSVRFTAS